MDRIIFILLTLMTFTACESVVDLDLDEQARQLVVNSIFTPNLNPNTPPYPFQVQLFESRPITSSEDFKIVEGATVKLYSDKEFLETLVYDTDRQLYTSVESTPEEHKSYLLKVEHPDYPAVNASSYVPNATPILSTTPSFKRGTSHPIIPNMSIEYVDIDIELDDPSGNNYYHFLFGHELVDYRVEGLDTIPDYSLVERHFGTRFRTDARNEEGLIIYNNVAIDKFGLYGAYLTDKNFDGQKKVVRLKLQYDLDPSRQLGENLFIEVRSVSKSYYDFHTTAIQNTETGANPFSNDPVAVSSNVQNGLGVFAGYTYQTKWVKLPR